MSDGIRDTAGRGTLADPKGSSRGGTMTCINCNVNITAMHLYDYGVHVSAEYRGCIHNWFYLWGKAGRATNFFTMFRLLGRIVTSLSLYHPLPMPNDSAPS